MPARHTDAPVIGERTVLALALIAVLVAVVGLVSDHFSRLDTTTFVLASLTVVAAGVQVVLLQRDRMHALSSADAAERLRGASTEGALDGVISIDAGGGVLEWNEAAGRIFGFDKQEVLGRELAELIVPPGKRRRNARACGDSRRRVRGRFSVAGSRWWRCAGEGPPSRPS